MRVVQLVSGTNVNGAVAHCHALSNELASRGHDILLIHRPRAWVSRQPLHQNVARLEHPIRRSRELMRDLAETLRDWKADVIHSHLSSASFFGVLLSRLFGFRCVATCHMTHLQPHWWWNDRVIAPSRAAAAFQRWINWVPSNRIDVIPNFINPDRFESERNRVSVRQNLGIEASAFLITVVGDVCSRKAQHVLVEALPQIHAAGVPSHVLIVGKVDAEYGRRVRAAIQERGLEASVSILGPRSDIADLYRASDCCCLPSHREVMPISLLEAMSMGLPVVSTNVGGIPECVRDDQDGLLVPAGDPSSLADALIRVAQDKALRVRLGVSARDRVEASFSPDACVMKIVQSYQRARHQAA